MMIKDLYKAILKLKTEEELELFFQDLLTIQEKEELSRRWLAARMLNDKFSYVQIEEQTGLSSTTIARVSKALKEGKGYNLILKNSCYDLK